MIQVLLVLAVSCAGFVQGEGGNDCCMSKTVGPHNYTLVDNDAAATTMGCKSPCVYQRNGEPGTRFCFKTGDFPVSCIAGSEEAVSQVCPNVRFVTEHTCDTCKTYLDAQD